MLALLLNVAAIESKTIEISVGPGNSFSPQTVDVTTGDVVKFLFKSSTHNVVQSSSEGGCSPSGFAYPSVSGLAKSSDSWQYTVKDSSVYYYCDPHCDGGMTGKLNFVAPANPPSNPSGPSQPSKPSNPSSNPPSSPSNNKPSDVRSSQSSASPLASASAASVTVTESLSQETSSATSASEYPASTTTTKSNSQTTKSSMLSALVLFIGSLMF